MESKRWVFILITWMLILTIIAAGCQSNQEPQGPPDGDYSKSGYLLTLDQGHYTVRDFEQGSYTVDGDQITFNAEEMTTEYCPGKSVYSYQWAFDAENNLLSFKPVNDPCSNRESQNTLGRWTYSKPSD